MKVIAKEHDIIVCTHKGGMGGWINEGEIAIVGGIHYSSTKLEDGYLAAKTVRNPEGNGCSCSCDYRLATSREIEYYNKGVRNVSDIPKEEIINNYEIY